MLNFSSWVNRKDRLGKLASRLEHAFAEQQPKTADLRAQVATQFSACE
jgi:hypothetical protein